MRNALLIFGMATLFMAGCAHNPSLSSDSPVADLEPTYAQKSPALYQSDTASDQAKDEDEDYLEDDEFEVVEVADPLYHWNKVWFHFNDKMYFWVLKPVAQGYKAVAPEPVRIGVKNFFHNLTTPIRLVGSLLQGKFERAGIELGNFLINTTWGVAGFGKVTKSHPELNPPPEDVGQALGSWGIGHGIYLVWPVLGPSSLRDTVGLVGDYFLHPATYVEPPWYAKSVIKGYDAVNETTFRIGDYEALKAAAIDPYVSIRDAYIQNRKKKVEE